MCQRALARCYSNPSMASKRCTRQGTSGSNSCIGFIGGSLAVINSHGRPPFPRLLPRLARGDALAAELYRAMAGCRDDGTGGGHPQDHWMCVRSWPPRPLPGKVEAQANRSSEPILTFRCPTVVPKERRALREWAGPGLAPTRLTQRIGYRTHRPARRLLPSVACFFVEFGLGGPSARTPMLGCVE
jgi:hypothetical protein